MNQTTTSGFTVTQRIKGSKNNPGVKQPRGGYVRPRDFTASDIEFGVEPLSREVENISPSLVGTVVDYMARLQQGVPKREAFKVSVAGASLAGQEGVCTTLLETIEGEDTESIVAACQLASFDSWARAYQPNNLDKAIPDESTIENIREMLRRCRLFFNMYGPMTLDGFGFEGAYTDIIVNGEGDFLTSDTLWDLKVVSGPITSKHTLQLLVYWRMGLRSIHADAFRPISKLGIFNPRLGKVYILPVSIISDETIEQVEHEVIGYGQTSKGTVSSSTKPIGSKASTPRPQRAASKSKSKKSSMNGCSWIVLIVLILLFAPLVLRGCASCSSDHNGNTVQTKKAESVNASKSSKPRNCDLKIVKAEVVKPYTFSDERALAVTLSWKNRRGSERSFSWEISGKAQQNGVVLSGSTFSAASSYQKLISNNDKKVINGKRLQTVYFFALDNLKHPVKVVFTDSHTGDQVVLKKTIKI